MCKTKKEKTKDYKGYNNTIWQSGHHSSETTEKKKICVMPSEYPGIALVW